MGPKAAEVYFTAFKILIQLIDAGAPCHSESMFAANLEHGRIQSIPMLKAWFSTVRPNGQAIAPDPMVNDIVHCFL